MHDTCTCMYNMALSKAYCLRRNFELAYLSTTFGSAVCFTTSVRNLIAYIKKQQQQKPSPNCFIKVRHRTFVFSYDDTIKLAKIVKPGSS